jgi:hypothetical protein
MNQTPSVFGAGRQVPGVREQARAGLQAPAHPRISIRGGSFTLVDAGGEEYPAPVMMHPSKRVPMMLAVIVGANGNKSKMYYPREWHPDSNEPPVCFSDNGIGPSSAAQSPQAVTCAECFFGKWGSAKSRLTGRDTKACSDRKKLAVMVVGDQTGLTYELQVPPASLGYLSDYSDRLAGRQLPGGDREPDLPDAVTMINFEPGQTGILEFEQIAWIDSVGITPQGVSFLNFDANGIQPAPDGGWGIAQRMQQIWESGMVEAVVGARDKPWQPGAGTNVAALPGMQYAPAALPAATAAPQQALPAHAPGAQYPQAVPHPQGPYAPPPGMPPSQPVAAFTAPLPPSSLPHAPPGMTTGAAPAPMPVSPPVPSRRGGARAGAGRKKQEQLPAPVGNVVQHPAMQQSAPPAPPFLFAAPDPAVQTNPNPAPASGAPGNGAGFGMTGAPPPPPGLEAAMAKAFELKTE